MTCIWMQEIPWKSGHFDTTITSNIENNSRQSLCDFQEWAIVALDNFIFGILVKYKITSRPYCLCCYTLISLTCTLAHKNLSQFYCGGFFPNSTRNWITVKVFRMWFFALRGKKFQKRANSYHMINRIQWHHVYVENDQANPFYHMGHKTIPLTNKLTHTDNWVSGFHRDLLYRIYSPR